MIVIPELIMHLICPGGFADKASRLFGITDFILIKGISFRFCFKSWPGALFSASRPREALRAKLLSLQLRPGVSPPRSSAGYMIRQFPAVRAPPGLSSIVSGRAHPPGRTRRSPAGLRSRFASLRPETCLSVPEVYWRFAPNWPHPCCLDRGGRFLPDHFRPCSDGLFFLQLFGDAAFLPHLILDNEGAGNSW